MTPGIHITKLHLKDAVLFKDASFEFKPGLTVIYGLNQTNARTSGNGNGAGKSAFFSQPGEILYETPIVGEKQDAVKTGSRLLSAVIKDKKVSIDRVGTKLNIKVDSKAKKFRTKPLARKWLAKNIPINQEEWNTYVHIDARIPHPLVMGSSTERRRFFTSFFGLDKLDMERKLFTAELAKLGKIRAGYVEVVAEYRNAKEQAIDEKKLKLLKAKIEAYQTELTDLNEKNIRLQAIAQLLNFEISAKVQLKALRAICPDGVDADTFETLIAETKVNLKENKAGLEDAIAWEQYERDILHYTKALNALSADATKLGNKLGMGAARKKCEAASESMRELAEEIHIARSNVKSCDAKIERKIKEVAKTKGNRSELLASIDSFRHQYSHAKKFKTGSCETCGQTVKVKNPAELKDKIAELEKQVDAIDAYANYRTALEEQEEAKSDHKEHQASLSELQKKYDALKRYANLCKEFANMPDKPQKFEGRKLEVKVMQRMVDEDREHIQLLAFLHPNLDTILALQKLTEKQRNSGSMASRLQERVNAIHEKLSKLRAKVEINNVVQENVQRLRKHLKAMKAELVNEEALRLLVESYSDKAMKRMAVKAISSRLMTEVNKYSRFVFPEDFEFEFNWDASQLSLLVHRKIGKKKVTSDVRKLSGAESKLFTLVLVLALLTFVPARKRCNCLFLDEPTANFSPETTERFKALLPVLNKVIPSIIVITPRTEERYENAAEWTMVKQSGWASLVAGHPSIIKAKRKS